MASKLLHILPYEAKNEFELSLRDAFEVVETKLRPPFPLSIPNPEQYSQLNCAILYAILTEPQFAKSHIKFLHALVTDGYSFFVCLLAKIVSDLYPKLLFAAKAQFLWVVNEMVAVCGVGFDALLVSLLRRIMGGDFGEGNLSVCLELVRLFMKHWELLVEEEPLILTSALYVFLRVLSDHCRASSNQEVESLKELEIKFCTRMLREHFDLCMKIGRDLVRLLQDLVHVPEISAIWKDLVLNPSEFRTVGFSDISQLYVLRTPSRYFLLQISSEMEAQLRFLLLHVKFGSQKRYQAWFSRRFLSGPESETLLVDIVRFVCGAHHPSNETIQSDVIPRWAVIGWLFHTCRRKYVEANAKLALFYDWLFFDANVDNIMNIEPAILLMTCSIPKYADTTNSLLEFLLLLVENYDRDRKKLVSRGVSSAFGMLVQKGVVHSLDVLTSSGAVSSMLKEKLGELLSPLDLPSPRPSPKSEPPLLPGSKPVSTWAGGSRSEVEDMETLAQEVEDAGGSESLPCFRKEAMTKATLMMVRSFVLSEQESARQLLFRRLARSSFPLGAHVLSFACELAHEATSCTHSNFSDVTGSAIPLLLFTIDGYFPSWVGRREDDSVSVRKKMDRKLADQLVEKAFSAYKSFLACSRAATDATHEEESLSATKPLLLDLAYFSQLEKKKLMFCFRTIFHHLSDLCVGDEDVLRLLLGHVDHADLLQLQFDLGLMKFSICGDNAEAIICLMNKSLGWDSLEQQKFWSLIRSELSISKVQVERIVLELFCSWELDPRKSSIAACGLLALCSSCAPNPKLVGVIMLLPGDVFHDFAPTALAAWSASNDPLLFDSLIVFLKKLEKESRDDFCSARISLNQSAALWLFNYFNAKGMMHLAHHHVLNDFSRNLLEKGAG